MGVGQNQSPVTGHPQKLSSHYDIAAVLQRKGEGVGTGCYGSLEQRRHGNLAERQGSTQTREPQNGRA